MREAVPVVEVCTVNRYPRGNDERTSWRSNASFAGPANDPSEICAICLPVDNDELRLGVLTKPG